MDHVRDKIVQDDVVLGGESFAGIVRTFHEDDICAVTAIHDTTLPVSIGGVRFVKQGTDTEVGHLAAAMTRKNAGAKLPAGGQKTIVVCPHGIPKTDAEKAEILAAHAKEVLSEYHNPVFGPDMDCGQPVMDLLSQDPEVAGHVTGLSEPFGGLAIDSNGATAKGVVRAIDVARRSLAAKIDSATIQGFGAVGAMVALLLQQEQGLAIRAICNRFGTIVDSHGGGLDVVGLYDAWSNGGDIAVIDWSLQHPNECVLLNDPKSIFVIHGDIFIPAARTDVIASEAEIAIAREENPDCVSVEFVAAQMSPKILAEAANHPLTHSAEVFLEGSGSIPLTDYIVNAGGVVHCLFEWAFRSEILSGKIQLDGLRSKAEKYTDKIVTDNTLSILTASSSKREAAEAVAAENGRVIRRALSNLRSHDTPDTIVREFFAQTLDGLSVENDAMMRSK